MKRIIFSLIAAAALCTGCLQQSTTETKSCTDKCCEVSTANITTPAQAISALKAGNARYVAGKMAFPNSDAKRRDETLNSQKPFAVVVSCSDSRVPVELLFDQGIGDLFVIRTAGNSVADDVVMGSIDYAVDHLGTPLVVILGHQNCGGVTSTIAHCEGSEEHHHGKIGELLAVLRQDVEQFVGHPEQLDEAIHVNAEAQVKRIKSVDYIAEKMKKGELQIISAYYHLDSGEVSFDE
ncbi:MAG: carbonic anhydrase [Rikenellaceae bacterium]